MKSLTNKRKDNMLKKIIRVFLSCVICASMMLSPVAAQVSVLNLPVPGVSVALSSSYVPMLLKGITIYPEDPFRFDFVIDSGDSGLKDDELSKEANRLIKYFLASLTIPDGDLWVNLSPYEADRIVPNELGTTELGRDMLAQDYLLKQITASLLNPQEELGEKFWNKIKERAQTEYGTSDVSVDAFNKVWIIPEEATIYEANQTAYVVDSHLKVLLEEDYAALNDSVIQGQSLETEKSPSQELSAQIVREIIIPELEREVNNGKNFALLRQIYHVLILARWYKEAVKETLLGNLYVDQKKTSGIVSDDPQITDKIYQQYIEAYKKGVFNFIKEDYDVLQQKVIPRQYFSGGFDAAQLSVNRATDQALLASFQGEGFVFQTSARVERDDNFSLVGSTDQFKPADAASLSKNTLEGLVKAAILLGIACTGAGCGAFENGSDSGFVDPNDQTTQQLAAIAGDPTASLAVRLDAVQELLSRPDANTYIPGLQQSYTKQIVRTLTTQALASTSSPGFNAIENAGEEVLELQTLGFSYSSSLVVAPLKEILADINENVFVRGAAARLLGRTGRLVNNGDGTYVFDALESVLDAPDGTYDNFIENSAADGFQDSLEDVSANPILGGNVTQAINLSQNFIQTDQNPLIRILAAEVLAGFNFFSEPGVQEFLFNQLVNDSDPLVRSAIANALGDTANSAVIPDLIAALALEQNAIVKEDIMQAIGALAPVLFSEFTQAQTQVEKNIVQGKIQDAIDALKIKLVNPLEAPDVIERAARTIAEDYTVTDLYKVNNPTIDDGLDDLLTVLQDFSGNNLVELVIARREIVQETASAALEPGKGSLLTAVVDAVRQTIENVSFLEVEIKREFIDYLGDELIEQIQPNQTLTTQTVTTLNNVVINLSEDESVRDDAAKVLVGAAPSYFNSVFNPTTGQKVWEKMLEQASLSSGLFESIRAQIAEALVEGAAIAGNEFLFAELHNNVYLLEPTEDVRREIIRGFGEQAFVIKTVVGEPLYSSIINKYIADFVQIGQLENIESALATALGFLYDPLNPNQTIVDTIAVSGVNLTQENSVVIASANALVVIGQPAWGNGTGNLATYLAQGTSISVRTVVAEALATLANPSLNPEAITQANIIGQAAEDIVIRGWSANGLGNIADFINEPANQAFKDNFVIPSLFIGYTDDTTPSGVFKRSQAVRALGLLFDTDTAHLVEYLNRLDVDSGAEIFEAVRAATATALGYIGLEFGTGTQEQTDIINGLQGAINNINETFFVKQAAQAALDYINSGGNLPLLSGDGTNESQPQLMASQQAESQSFQRQAQRLAAILFNYKAEQSVVYPNLAQLQTVIAQLGLGVDPIASRNATIFLTLTAFNNPDQRIQAVAQLGELGLTTPAGSNTQAHIMQLLNNALVNDPDPFVRQEAQTAINQINDANQTPDVTALESVLDLLIQLDGEQSLIQAFDIKLQIINALSEIDLDALTVEDSELAEIIGWIAVLFDTNYNSTEGRYLASKRLADYSGRVEALQASRAAAFTDVNYSVRMQADQSNVQLGGEIIWNDSDSAQLTLKQKENVGGIDLNQININRQGSGIDVEYRLDVFNPIFNQQIQGLSPVILNVVPIQSILPILGLESSEKSSIKISKLEQ